MRIVSSNEFVWLPSSTVWWWCGQLCVQPVPGEGARRCVGQWRAQVRSNSDTPRAEYVLRRSQCASRNTAKLSTFPPHLSLSCSKCKGRLRLWPDQGPKFVCDSPAGSCARGDGARQSARHQNR